MIPLIAKVAKNAQALSSRHTARTPTYTEKREKESTQMNRQKVAEASESRTKLKKHE